VGASIISTKASELFGVEAPMALLLTPKSGVDRSSIEAELAALAERHPEIQIATLAGMTELQTQVFDMLPNLFNALLVLAIVVAALGAINTIMMSITERRRELSLLRAVGATQRQVNEVVLYEAALMGAVGGALGLIGGAGIIIILATVYGGNAWGVPDLDLWEAAWQAVQPGIMNGLVGLVVAPFICAGAALWPMRIILRGLAIASLQVEQR
jgi:ABC-type antimicrobial peptide transport system permease subunit